MPSQAFGLDKWITGNGLQLHYVEWGTSGNPTMVLLHGFQSNAHTWDTFSQAMAAQYHVFALDQRGHGDSDRAPDGEYASPAFVTDIVEFIRALHLSPTLLIGHSMGGRHAAMVAADYPDIANKVVIVDTPAELPPAIRAMLRPPSPTEAPLQVEVFNDFEAVITKAIAEYSLTPEAELRHANYHNLWRSSDGKWRWRWDLGLLQYRRSHRNLQLDLYPYLQRLQCPTLLVRGASSPLLTSEVAQKMMQALPHGRFVEIEHAAHTVNADNAAAFNAALQDFLRT
jgi:pimeloyl-ACP methyl ester carboxylesterase